MNTPQVIAINLATPADFKAIWPLFQAVIQAGDTYPYPPDMTFEDAQATWFAADKQVFIAQEGTEVLGTYYLRPNQPGLAAHVCNAGFMVSPHTRGKGVGRLMGEHALKTAKAQGYLAMQFNLVVETNVPSIRLWQSLGFEILATIPNAFQHQQQGLVGAHIMYRTLDDVVDL